MALQLGGSEPDDLAHCAKLVEQYGYDEVNLNIGCPSERVQRGAFGACLMAEPELVADCVAAMRSAVKIPVTVKHRIGIDKVEDYDFVRDFVGTVSQAGCKTFIAHARNAVLKGLSPKENREIPPLKYDYVYRLKQDFPHLEIVINGGITSQDRSKRISSSRRRHARPRGLPRPLGAGRRRQDTRRTSCWPCMSTCESARGRLGQERHPAHARPVPRPPPRARLWRRMLSDRRAFRRTIRTCCSRRWKQ